MPAQRTVLALAELSEEQLSTLQEDAKLAEFAWQRVESLRAAVVSLATKPPSVALVDLSIQGAEAFCYKVRGKRRASDIAVFGLARKLTDQTFAKAFQWGVDDVISVGAEGALSARLVALPADQSVAPMVRGDAMVADADATRANLIARTLTNAGYDVRHVTDKLVLRQYASGAQLRLVVASSDLGFARSLITESRNKGGLATWIVTCQPGDQEGLKQGLQGLERVGVVSVFDPVNDILYVSNELSGGPVSRGRLEPRLAYGTLVVFRAAGAEENDYGFTYNISPHGMYVRTLAPPVEDRVWLEVRPPASRRRVRLEGEVMWRRNYGRLGTATAPPGFGVRIVAGLAADQNLWIDGFNSLRKETHAAGTFEPPKAVEPAPIQPVEGAAPKASGHAAPRDQPSVVAMAIADVMESAPPQPGAVPPLGGLSTRAVASTPPGRSDAPAPRLPSPPAPSPESAEVEFREIPASALELADAVAEIEDLENAPTRVLEAPPALSKAKPPEETPTAPLPFAKTALVGTRVRPEAAIGARKGVESAIDEDDIEGALSALEVAEPSEPAPAKPPSDRSELEWVPGGSTDAKPKPPPLMRTSQWFPGAGTGPSPVGPSPPSPARPAGPKPPSPAAAEPPASAEAEPVSAAAPSLEQLAAPPQEPGTGRPVEAAPASTVQPAKPRKGSGHTLPALLALGGGTVVAAALAGAGYYLHTQGMLKGVWPSPASSVAQRKTTPASAPSSRPAPAASTAAPTASAQPASSAAPPAAEPASSATAPGAEAEEGGDGSELLWSQGYLIVSSSADASVYVNAVNAGPTNKKVKVKCRLRWVRLGKDPGPTWISPGKTVNVECQSITRVTIEPSPAAGP